MEVFADPQAWLFAGMIFGLRVLDTTLDTLRLLYVMRGRKGLAWLLAFFEGVVYVLAIGSVLSNLKNPLNVIGYAAGFATGNVVGIWLEERLAVGHILLNIISPQHGPAIAESLRAAGFAVTVTEGQGRDGPVEILNCSVMRRQVGQAERIIEKTDPHAFITGNDLRSIRRGFWGV